MKLITENSLMTYFYDSRGRGTWPSKLEVYVLMITSEIVRYEAVRTSELQSPNEKSTQLHNLGGVEKFLLFLFLNIWCSLGCALFNGTGWPGHYLRLQIFFQSACNSHLYIEFTYLNYFSFFSISVD